ncbi:hypothetical protein PSDVSF_27880 [Pseudodesulfovibrio sediminis]|uniref:Uncharacterized protein n=2 Tax=Pseudodesulfovibrio sediminis TaxID=2810563 RepID=A0ABM7P939_9BACT|nr:hypothetical protein PSDVSF_27880 [Pseudodesulfovibrio sediminis]
MQSLQGNTQQQELRFTKPNLKKWLGFYHKHRQLTDESEAYYSQATASSFDTSLLGNLYGKSEQLSEDSINGILESAPHADSFELPDMEDHIFPLAVAFNILVWLPCMVFYGDYPCVLLRKARHGNEKVLCDLIRLDRSVLFDSIISKRVHEWTLDSQMDTLEKIGTAFRTGLSETPLVKIKLAWAQYVYDSSRSFGMPLNAPDVRALFDAHAQDSGIGMHDPDLSEMTDDAFYQALAKRKKPLSGLLKYRRT